MRPAGKKAQVVLGMSGGVDSSVAAKLLCEQGYEVLGVTLKVWEEEDEQAASKRWQERGCCKVGMARHVANMLNISHQVVDIRETFEKGVIEDFIQGYLNGTTPNPCVRCNERVKFGSLFEVAEKLGADFVATGHYAQVSRTSTGAPVLSRGHDPKKDQSYFLYRLPSKWLDKMLFPLGKMEKSSVWQEAESMGLPVEELKESQEICFVSQGDYRQFLKANAPEASRPGLFVDAEGHELGQHEGVAFYTPGQRKGLGLATGARMYVQRVQPDINVVVLGPAEGLASTSCLVSDLNVFDPEQLTDGSGVEVKFRYASHPVPARVEWKNANTINVQFHSPVRALSPGQSAVFYSGPFVLGGGIIQGHSDPLITPLGKSVSSLSPASR